MKRGTLHRNLRISGRSPDRTHSSAPESTGLPRVTTRTCRVLCIIGPVRSPIGGLFERSLPPSALSGAFKNDPRVRDERGRGMCGTTGERAAPIRWVSGTFTLAAEPAGVDVAAGDIGVDGRAGDGPLARRATRGDRTIQQLPIKPSVWIAPAVA